MQSFQLWNILVTATSVIAYVGLTATAVILLGWEVTAALVAWELISFGWGRYKRSHRTPE